MHLEGFAGAALGIGALVLVWLGTWQLITSERVQQERSAQAMLSNLAIVFEEDTIRSLSAVDQTLRYLRASYAQDPENFSIPAWATRVQAITDFTFQTVIVGPDGIMKGSNIPSTGRVDLNDREHFRVHADGLVDGLFISKPIFDRVSNRWSIQLTRRINNPDGSFGGVAVISVDPAYFAKFYGSIDLGAHGSIMLVGTDGVIRARKTAGGLDTGTSLAGTILFRTWQQNPDHGLYIVSHSRTDGIGRLVAYHTVKGLPLIVTVSTGLDDIYAVYRYHRASYLLTAVLISAGILAMTILIVRYERRVTRAKEAAEAGTRARSAFLAAMSHEIRTPMNAVLGLAGSLLETPLSPEQRRSIAAINSAGGHLLRILNDILDFSKMEAGRIPLERTSFSPETTVANVLSVISPRAQAKGLTISQHCDPDLPAVEGDAGRVGQVLMNLVTNAVKFTEHGAIQVKVECLRRHAGSATIRWSVVDTGIGIAADRTSRLFREFVQADYSIARRYGGSGLGLAICKRLVTLMGGEIGVESREGQGSVFWFTLSLPVARSLTSTSEIPARACIDALAAATKRMGRPARVLVAEDNATNQMVVEKMLEGPSVALTIVADGAEAVEAATNFPFDIVFMDMCMPNMDGLQATAAIRTRGGALAKLPIVALSANILPEDVQACRDAGMTGFIGKPVRKRELIDAVLQALPQASLAVNRPDLTSDRLASDQAHTTSGPSIPDPLAAASTDPGGIDREKLDILADEIGPDGVTGTLKVYIAETEERLRLLEALSCAQDRARIRVEAHTLKGASAAFGLSRLSAAARELELSAADITADRYVAVVEQLKAVFASDRSYLDQRLADASAA